MRDEILAEQFTRNVQFFGKDAQARIAGSFVVVVGLGGVGSHAANLLLRSGVSRLRLVDFDQVMRPCAPPHTTHGWPRLRPGGSKSTAQGRQRGWGPKLDAKRLREALGSAGALASASLLGVAGHRLALHWLLLCDSPTRVLQPSLPHPWDATSCTRKAAAGTGSPQIPVSCRHVNSTLDSKHGCKGELTTPNHVHGGLIV